MQMNNLKIGLLVDLPFTCVKEVIDIFPPNVIILRGNSYFQFAYEPRQQLDECKVQIKKFNRTILLGAIHRVPDTGKDNIVNTSRLVSSWELAAKWANNSGNIVIFSTAFDLPYKTEIANKTTGWWCLVENSSYNSVTDYIFEEKYLIAKLIDSEENPENFQWVRNPIYFHANTTGMFFQEDELSKLDLKSLAFKELIRSNIKRILVIDNKYLKQGSVMKYSELDVLNTILLKRYSKTNFKQNQIKNVGLYFSRSLCETYQQLEATAKRKLFDNLSSDYSIFVFYYSEKVEIVKLGARRMFQQRVVKLDLCRQMVLQSGNTRTQIGYTLLEYPDIVSAHQSPWALQNIVKYYRHLNDWAITQTNVIIFLPGLDRVKIPMLGWWRIKSTENGTSLVDKRTDALAISETPFSPNMSKNKTMVNEDRIVIIVCTSIAMIVTTATLSILCFKRHRRGKNKLSHDELDNFYNGMNSEDILDAENYVRVPYDKKKYEIEESKFSIDSGEKPLGTGEFGKVIRGRTTLNGNTIDVAIKTTNPETSHTHALKGLLSEIKLLAFIGKHPNITELIGANTENLRRGKCWIILELCHLGSLQKYLRDIGMPTNNLVVEYSYDSVSFANAYTNMPMGSSNRQLDMELSNDLYRWSIEICNALVYLSEKHVVHADLATRNILLDLRKVAKICDFGLSRRMYNYTGYVKTNQEPLPWKWMAPESLRFMQFSEKSDVWSFGVTLWEIYTFGEVPYQGMSWDVNFVQMLERGLRLSEPRYNEHNRFVIMRSCWKINADQRPSFSSLFNLLTTKQTIKDNFSDETYDST